MSPVQPRLSALGWTPRFTIRDSIRSYWRYLNEQRDIEDIIEHAESTMRRLNVVRSVAGAGAS